MKKANAQLILNRLLEGVSALELLECDDATLAAVKELREEANAADEKDIYVWLGVGKRVDAIKTVRIVSGMGLKEAKEFVDRYDNTPSMWIGPVKRIPSCEERAYRNAVEGESGTASIRFQ